MHDLCVCVFCVVWQFLQGECESDLVDCSHSLIKIVKYCFSKYITIQYDAIKRYQSRRQFGLGEAKKKKQEHEMHLHYK